MMRTTFQLVRLVIFIAIILVIGRGLSLSEYAQWFLIIGVTWLAIWGVIVTWIIEWIAKRLFDSSVDWRWKPDGKWYAYSRGFVHLNKDGVNLGRSSCLLTVFSWILTLPVFIVGVTIIIPQLAIWLSANF
jgi:hypothetical protein